MNIKVVIDNTQKEDIIIYSKENNDVLNKIKSMFTEDFKLLLYKEDEIIKTELMNISVFYVMDNKVYAMINNENYLVKERLYKIYEEYQEQFVRINKSSLVNVNHIRKFVPSIGGSIKVILKNGYNDYISRRELKNVKRRLGL